MIVSESKHFYKKNNFAHLFLIPAKNVDFWHLTF